MNEQKDNEPKAHHFPNLLQVMQSQTRQTMNR